MAENNTDFPMTWHPGTSEVATWWAISTGIEQAWRGEGTMLSDEDLFMREAEETLRNLDKLFGGEHG